MTLWWKQVWCPYCGAPPGQYCVTVGGYRTYAHADRVRDGEYYVFEELDEWDEDLARLVEIETRQPRPMTTVYLPGDGPRDRPPA